MLDDSHKAGTRILPVSRFVYIGATTTQEDCRPGILNIEAAKPVVDNIPQLARLHDRVVCTFHS